MQGTHAQVCKDSSVLGHAPRKALKVKKATKKGSGKTKPQKASVEAVMPTKKGAHMHKKAAKVAKVAKAVKVAKVAKAASATPPASPGPRSPTYEPTEAWQARIEADAGGAGPQETAPEGRRQNLLAIAELQHLGVANVLQTVEQDGFCSDTESEGEKVGV